MACVQAHACVTNAACMWGQQTTRRSQRPVILLRESLAAAALSMSG